MNALLLMKPYAMVTSLHVLQVPTSIGVVDVTESQRIVYTCMMIYVYDMIIYLAVSLL